MKFSIVTNATNINPCIVRLVRFAVRMLQIGHNFDQTIFQRLHEI